jgi:hypothetical protein
MGKRRQRNASHAEGEHGPKTERRIIEQLESGPSRTPLVDRLAIDREIAAVEGKRRLVDDREQHDPSERNSERTHIFDELERGTAD